LRCRVHNQAQGHWDFRASRAGVPRASKALR
jgi:hypothetical protein